MNRLVRRSCLVLAAALSAVSLAACTAGSGGAGSSGTTPGGSAAPSAGAGGPGEGSGGESTGSEGTGSEGGAADPDATLRLGLATIPASLDFTNAGGAAIFQALVGNVYEGLVALDEDGQVVPLLAESWDVSEDGLTYSFHLREGVTFHDGTPFDAEIVKFSLERLREWTANTPGLLGAIERVDVVSPTQADVVVTSPDADVLFWLTTVLGVMMTPDSVDSLATAANGTGPFEFVGYRQGVQMDLARYDGYWGEPAGVAAAQLVYYADASAAANALRTGGVDALFQAEAFDQVAGFEAEDRFEVTVGTTQSVVVLSMNSTNEALSDARVRRAISQAINKEDVMLAATSGYGTVLTGPSVPTDPWYTTYPDAAPYDPQAAEALLAEAGVSGLRLDFTVPARPYAEAIAQVVQNDLADIGITANLTTQEFPAVWVERTLVNHDYDLTVISHVEARNMVNYGNPDYYWAYDNPQVRELFAQAKAALTPQDQAEAMVAAQDAIVADAAGVWLYNNPNIVIARSGVSGLPVNYLGAGIELAGVTITD